MKTNGIVLTAVWILAAASPAWAAPSASLTAGGQTLAGPGNTNIGVSVTTTVYTHPAVNTDVCATVINSSINVKPERELGWRREARCMV